MTARSNIVAGFAGTAFLLSGFAFLSPDASMGIPSAMAKDGGGGNSGGGNSGGGGGSTKGNSGNSASPSNAGGNSKASGNGGGKSTATSKSTGGAPGGSSKTKSSSGSTVAKVPASDAPDQVKKASVAPGQAKKDSGLDAKVGALHAVNANLQAYLHASPNSRVGKIGAYAQSLVAAEGAAGKVVAAEEGVKTATDELAAATSMLSGAIDELKDAVYDAYLYPDYEPETLQGRREELASIDPASLTPEQLDAVAAEIAAIDKTLAANEAVAGSAEDLAAANEALSEANTSLATAEADSQAALDTAANKAPVDAEVKGYVDTQLEEGGILDYYREQVALPPVQ